MRLTHVSGFCQIAMNENIFSIKLVNKKFERNGGTENGVNGGWFDKRTKGVIKIKI